MKRLLNRVAVVTGGTRGLGLEIARLYGREGALVVIGSRSESGVGRAARALRAQGLEVTGQGCDVTERAQGLALRDLALRTYGRLDLWVNNAGLGGVSSPTHAVPPEDFERVTRTNLLGTTRPKKFSSNSTPMMARAVGSRLITRTAGWTGGGFCMGRGLSGRGAGRGTRGGGGRLLLTPT